MRCVVFDLDGTLTQSDEGIINSFAYAAEKLGFPMPEPEVRRQFIGPPLTYSFRTFFGMDEETVERAVEAYRERYFSVGLFENRVYPGIRHLLIQLKRRGDWVAVATGKIRESTVRILDHFGLSPWIDRVVCQAHNGRAEKDELIRSALPETYDEVWVVGDRRFDIEGGRALGFHTVGALYGYGSREELETAGSERIAETAAELSEILCPGDPVPAGAFLSMEGLDGSGKSTQLALLTEALERRGYEVVHTREPGGTPIGERVREILLDPASRGMAPETEALLYAASRAQHVREVIRPALAAGKVVLSDRFVDSSVAYQGGGRELGVGEVLDINAPALDGTLPLATVYLSLSAEASLARRTAASEPDRLESEPLAFHRRVEAAYRALIDRDPGRFVVVDASLPPKELGEQIAAEVLRRLAEQEARA